MKPKLLIMAIYPAPYRMGLFEYFAADFDIDIFFEQSGGDQRNKEWFKGGNYFCLDTAQGIESFKEVNVKNYDLAVFYDYTGKQSMKLIIQCKRKKVPYIINCDGVMMTNHGNVLKDLIKRYFIKSARYCFASGVNAKKYFLKYGAKEKNIAIHTFSTLNKEDILKEPLSQAKKIEAREKLGLQKTVKIAIAVGRFIPLKRYNELIAQWKDMPTNYKLLLVGNGEQKELYEQTIKNLKLKNVIIRDFAQKEKLLEYYRAADIFIHPTSYDVWGLVVNEAMSQGLPCVVSDHCIAGLELIKDGENGYLVKMGDDKAAVTRAKEIFQNAQICKTMSVNALKTIDTYTIENMAKIHIEKFSEIV